MHTPVKKTTFMKHILSLLVALCASKHAQTLYTVTDLGTLGGPTSFALAINASGVVTGQADRNDDTTDYYHAVVDAFKRQESGWPRICDNSVSIKEIPTDGYVRCLQRDALSKRRRHEPRHARRSKQLCNRDQQRRTGRRLVYFSVG